MERKFGVSTDSSGVLGTPETWRGVYGFLMNEKNFLGFEMLGWRWAKSLLKLAADNDVKIVGIHGRMGLKDGFAKGFRQNLRIKSLEFTLNNTATLLNLHSGYLLLHETEAGNRAEEIANAKATSCNTLFVENIPDVSSLEGTLKTAADLASSGVPSGVMFDLQHYAFELMRTPNTNHTWDRVLNALDKTLETLESKKPKIRAGIHLPIGEDAIDSLSFDQMSFDMWLDLTAILNKHPQTITIIENQQAGINQAIVLGKSIKRQRAINETKINRLFQTGILQG